MGARLKRPVREEGGFAIIMALGVLIALGISSAALIEYTSSNARATNLGQGSQSASQLAEAGINAAYSVLNYWDSTTQRNNAADATLLGCNSAGTSCTPFTFSEPGGNVSWYGTLNTTTSVWTITSTGTARNPTGAASLKKTILATVPVTWNTTQPSNATAWNYAMSTNTSNSTSCDMIVSNSVVVDSPLYLAGNLCLQNSASVQETTDPETLNVRGKLGFANTASVGTSSKSISYGAAAGGCGSFSGTSVGTTHACARPGDPWYVVSNGSQPAVTAPTVDTTALQSDYNSANPGPTHACDSATRSGSYPSFDSDTTMNGGASSFNLTPAASYTCKAFDSNGSQVGELSWNVSTHTLTIRGMMFFDGSLTSTDSSATYNGSATVYVNGSFTMSQTAQLCANANCDFTTWNPNTEMLLIVAAGSASTNISLSNSVKFQGGFFSNKTVSMQNSVQVMGPMISGTFDWGNSVTVKPLPTINTLPLGAPGNPNVHAAPGRMTYLNG